MSPPHNQLLRATRRIRRRYSLKFRFGRLLFGIYIVKAEDVGRRTPERILLSLILFNLVYEYIYTITRYKLYLQIRDPG
jgi:hypothetical protein